MRTRRLAVEGAVEFTPEVHPDDRGHFLSHLQQAEFRAATGHPGFPAAQLSISKSRRGVVRGVHFAATPPGTAKYVHCTSGRALDIIVDIRVGSPTFGRHDTVLLDQQQHRAAYLPIGVGHMFVALEDETVLCYALSTTYTPKIDLGLSPVDPALRLPIPAGLELVLSTRDRAAPTLAQAQARGLLPEYATCRKAEDTLWPASGREE